MNMLPSWSNALTTSAIPSRHAPMPCASSNARRAVCTQLHSSSQYTGRDSLGHGRYACRASYQRNRICIVKFRGDDRHDGNPSPVEGAPDSPVPAPPQAQCNSTAPEPPTGAAIPELHSSCNNVGMEGTKRSSVASQHASSAVLHWAASLAAYPAYFPDAPGSSAAATLRPPSAAAAAAAEAFSAADPQDDRPQSGLEYSVQLCASALTAPQQLLDVQHNRAPASVSEITAALGDANVLPGSVQYFGSTLLADQPHCGNADTASGSTAALQQGTVTADGCASGSWYRSNPAGAEPSYSSSTVDPFDSADAAAAADAAAEVDAELAAEAATAAAEARAVARRAAVRDRAMTAAVSTERFAQRLHKSWFEAMGHLNVQREEQAQRLIRIASDFAHNLGDSARETARELGPPATEAAVGLIGKRNAAWAVELIGKKNTARAVGLLGASNTAAATKQLGPEGTVKVFSKLGIEGGIGVAEHLGAEGTAKVGIKLGRAAAPAAAARLVEAKQQFKLAASYALQNPAGFAVGVANLCFNGVLFLVWNMGAAALYAVAALASLLAHSARKPYDHHSQSNLGSHDAQGHSTPDCSSKLPLARGSSSHSNNGDHGTPYAAGQAS